MNGRTPYLTIVHIVEPFASGVATFVKSLVDNLTDDYHIIIHGERLDIMEADQVKKQFISRKIKFIHWKSAQRGLNLVYDLKAFFELYHILNRLKKVDAVHLHSSKSGFIGRLTCRLLGIKNVIYTPNGAPFLMNESQARKSFYKALEKIGALFGGKTVCVSASEADAYRKIGIKASYINNGTTSEILTERKESPFTNDFIIAFSGRITAQKNPHRFNEIAEKFIHLNNIHFKWIGDGEDRELLTSPNITVTGWLDEAGVRKELSKTSLYLSTSDYEGLSFGVLEAMSLGKPLILSNCTGNKDIIRYGVNGDLFDTVEQAYTQVLYYTNNPAMLQAMGNYSKALIKSDFNADTSAKSYRMVYTC